MAKRKVKRKAKTLIKLIFLVLLSLTLFQVVKYFFQYNKELEPIEIHNNDYYGNSDFGINTVVSDYDLDSDGVDDYADILAGAKIVAKINPAYVNKYYAGGYPPQNEGTCTDVIWVALKEAGYYIKDMMGVDIRANRDQYPSVDIVDDNIDFRRVRNIEVFLRKYTEILTNDYHDIEEFQPGDIVTFGDSAHIAIVSDKRNGNGITYIIQNSDEEQTEKEEDVFEEESMPITGHYRLKHTEKLQDIIDKI